MLKYVAGRPGGKWTRTGQMYFDEFRNQFWLRLGN